jgi:hypothetical protein
MWGTHWSSSLRDLYSGIQLTSALSMIAAAVAQ